MHDYNVLYNRYKIKPVVFIYFMRITNSQCLQVDLLWSLTKSLKHEMLVMMTLFLLKVFTGYNGCINMNPNFTEVNES